MSFTARVKKAERSSNPRYGAYLLSRHGTLYFRIAVPNHLQSLLNKREIRRSLGTSKLREARVKAMRLAVVVQDYFFLAEQCLKSKVQSIPQNHLQQLEITLDKLKSDGTFLLDIGLESCDFGQHMTSAFSSPESQTSPLLTITNDGPTATGLPQAEPAISVDAKIQDNIGQTIVKRRIKTQAVKPGADGGSSKVLPTLSQAAEAYISAKKLTWSRSSIKDIPPQIKQFVAIVAELESGRRDILLTQISRDHIRRYYDTLRFMPHRINGKKEFRQKTWLALADLGRNGFAGRLLSEKTLAVRQNNVRSFINWCELEYQGLIQARYLNTGFPKAATDNDLRRKGVHREAFTPDELRALFDDMDYYRQATEDSPSKYWCPLIALYSGMRVEEICQLHLSDIVQIDGVWCFSVNTDQTDSGYAKHVKSMAGIRLVPIHSHLWDPLGLKAYVELRQRKVTIKYDTDSFLFPEMHERAKQIENSNSKLGAPISQWFTRYRRSVGVGGMDGEVSTKTFHSFRHTVIEYLHKQARVNLSMLQAVVGHEVTNMGVTEVYAGAWPLEVLKNEVIDKIGWVILF